MAASEHTAALAGRDASRVAAATVGVPVLVLAAGALAGAADARLGFVAAAIVLGWTQLVGI